MYIMWEPCQRFVHRESPDLLATDERIDRTLWFNIRDTFKRDRLILSELPVWCHENNVVNFDSDVEIQKMDR